MKSLRNRRWLVHESAPASFTELLGCSQTLASLFWSRGMRTFEAVSHSINLRDYPYGIHNPLLMAGMDEAVQKICETIEAGAPITIYGDYDVDGVTSTVLLAEVLTACGAEIHTYIPARHESYGLHASIVNSMIGWNSPLLITVDCGIKSVEEVENIMSCGIDVIVTDHHLPGAALPPTICLNPKIPPYPYEMLAGVGTAYKLATALMAKHPGRLRARSILDLVALGTVADMVPLTGENRVLASAGLRALRESPRPGIAALCQVTKIKQDTITAMDIGFMLGPRINAAGRMAHANLAYDLLTTQNPQEARKLAVELHGLNQQRQELTEKFSSLAKQLVDAQRTIPPIIVVALDACNDGIVGLVAGELVKHYGAPAVVLNKNGQTATGSARSLAPLDMVAALDSAAHLLVRYGGHALAAGLSIEVDQIPALEKALHRFAQGMEYTQTLYADAHLELADLTWGLLEELELLEPYGMDNQRPVFYVRGHVTGLRRMGKQEQHLGFEIALGDVRHKAVWWKAAEYAPKLKGLVALLVSVGINEWNDERTLQLEVHDAQILA